SPQQANDERRNEEPAAGGSGFWKEPSDRVRRSEEEKPDHGENEGADESPPPFEERQQENSREERTPRKDQGNENLPPHHLAVSLQSARIQSRVSQQADPVKRKCCPLISGEEGGAEESRQGGDQGMRAQAPGEDVRSENGGDRGDEKREMEGGLVLAGDHRHESDEVRGERGVLHDLPHGLLGAVPVHGEPVK